MKSKCEAKHHSSGKKGEPRHPADDQVCHNIVLLGMDGNLYQSTKTNKAKKHTWKKLPKHQCTV